MTRARTSFASCFRLVNMDGQPVRRPSPTDRISTRRKLDVLTDTNWALSEQIVIILAVRRIARGDQDDRSNDLPVRIDPSAGRAHLGLDALLFNRSSHGQCSFQL